MANAQLPDAFYDLVAHHLPPEKPVGPKGGRPTIPHRIALKVIWFVLVSGCRWEDVPREMGCSGRTAHRRLRLWEELGVWDHLHADLLRLLRQDDKLDPDLVIVDGVIVRAFGGGEGTGPSPVDRAKKGSKHTLMVDWHGVPLASGGVPGVGMSSAMTSSAGGDPLHLLALDVADDVARPGDRGRGGVGGLSLADRLQRRRRLPFLSLDLQRIAETGTNALQAW